MSILWQVGGDADARGGPFSTLTTKRFTGQYHEEALGLYFYGARWYDPLLGSFTQPDTLIPDPAAPQAFNRYAYTLNNPLRYVDPSGHCIPGWNCEGDDHRDDDGNGGGGHHGGGGRGGGRGWHNSPSGTAQLPSIEEVPYWFNPEFGWIDRSHMIPTLAQIIIDGVDSIIQSGGGELVLERQAMGPKVLGIYLTYFERRYYISSAATPDQSLGIALGIFMDAGEKWEAWQGKVAFGMSAFHIEDLPSNYLGFVEAARGWSEKRVLVELGTMTPSSDAPYCAWSDCGAKTSLPPNFKHQPMIFKNGQWVNVSWPSQLKIAPVESSPNTWWFISSESSGLWGRWFNQGK